MPYGPTGGSGPGVRKTHAPKAWHDLWKRLLVTTPKRLERANALTARAVKRASR
jgi:hypothetical protein